MKVLSLPTNVTLWEVSDLGSIARSSLDFISVPVKDKACVGNERLASGRHSAEVSRGEVEGSSLGLSSESSEPSRFLLRD